MSTSPPPVVADRYRLVAPLGQGGMGRVWRATDVVLHRDVAIKELAPPPGLTTEERQEMRERSLREARAIARLNHVNVVRVFDVLRTDADPWIVMEYVPSRSLQDILAADGPYPPARAAEIGLGVLGALRAAHRAGVVHRDVKPGNVLIGEDGRVVLTDFGLATVPGDPNVTRTGLVLGSPAYIAPERARDGSAGPGADLWSLGATLYAAVEGASPFARPSAIATLAALATENPPPARNAGPLKGVLNGLLRKDPAQRISAEEAERLLLRATGRRSRLSFPMNATMRRPGLGRERPSAPLVPPVVPGSPQMSGPTTASGPATGSAPVVPGPRPPVSPAHPPASSPGPGRPPVFAPGKATVGRPAAIAPVTPAVVAKPTADPPTRVDAAPVGRVSKGAAPLDATRVDTPPLDATRVDTSLDTPPLDATRVDTPAVPAADSWTRGRARPVPVVSPQSLTKPSGPTEVPSRTSPGAATDRVTASAAGAASVPVIPPPSRSPVTPTSGTLDPETVDAPAVEQAKAPVVEQIDAPAAEKPAEKPGEQADLEPAAATVDGATDTATDSSGGAAETPAPVDPAPRATAPAEAAEAGTSGGAADKASAPQAATPTTPTPTIPTPTIPTLTIPTAPVPAGSGGPRPIRNKIKGKAGKAKSGKAARNGRDTTATSDVRGVTGPGASPVTGGTAVAAEVPTAEASAVEVPAAEVPVAEVPATGATTSVAAAKPAQVEAKAVTAAKTAVAAPASRAATQAEAAGTGRRTPEMRTPSTSGAMPFSGAPTGSSRPPWQPMPVRAPSTGRAGLTIFGVTLDRRQTWFLVAIVAVVLLALLLVVPNAFGDDDKGARGPGGGAPSTSAAVATPPTPAPVAPAPVPSAAATTTVPPAPTSAAPPPPTRAAATPTSKAPPSRAPAQDAALPADWRMHRDRSGYAVPIPQGWSVQQQGTETYFREPGGSRRVLIVDQTNSPRPDPEADWAAQERSRRGDYRNYRLLRIDSVSYRGWNAADWEYTYTTRSGNDVRSVKRGFITAPDRAYGISWTAPAGRWEQDRGDLQRILDGFRPAGS